MAGEIGPAVGLGRALRSPVKWTAARRVVRCNEGEKT
jgi:hypothetical protein